jgi:transcriptional regulator with XRE-family HTH domain
MNKIREILSGNIRRRLEELGWSQKDLALKTKKSVSWVAQICNNRRWPEFGSVEALSQALGVDESWLFTDHSKQAEPTAEQAIRVIAEKLKVSVEEKWARGDSFVSKLSQLDSGKRDAVERFIETLEILPRGVEIGFKSANGLSHVPDDIAGWLRALPASNDREWNQVRRIMRVSKGRDTHGRRKVSDERKQRLKGG